MSSPLKFLPWPGNVRVRVNVAGVWTEITRWVLRAGLQISYATDTFTAEGSIPLEIPGNQTQPIFEAWQEVRIDNPGLNYVGGATQERYFKGYIGDFTSDPQAPSRKLTLHVMSGLAILERARDAIIGPYVYPAGTADNVIIADLMAYADMAGEISTVPSVNHIFDVDAEITFQNCTLLEALQQLQQATPAGIEAPVLAMYWYDDDPPAHTDNWGWRLQWFQSGLIPLSGIKLTDGVHESSGGGLGEAFYRALSRTRDGKRVINRQPVEGGPDPVTGLPIRHTTNSTTSQTYLGRILTGKPIVDTTLDTLDKVMARGRLEVDRWKDVLETLSNIRTLVPYGVNGPIRVQIKRAIEPGIDTYTTYLITKITLSFDSAGLPFFTLTLGTGLPELGRSGVGWRGGVRYQQPTAPPQVTGVAIAENVYLGGSQSSRFKIVWAALTTGNLHHYQVNWSWFDGTIWHYNYVDVPHPGADVYLATITGGLLPGTHYLVDIIAWNIFHQHGPPSATVEDDAAGRDAPGCPTSISVVPYVDQGTGGVKVTYTPAPDPPVPSFTDIEWGTVDGLGVERLIHVERVPVGATPPDAVKIAPLTVGQRYFFQLFGVMANGVDRGAGSTPIVKRVGGNTVGGPPLPVPVDGLWTDPFATDGAGLVGYGSDRGGTGDVAASTDYLWRGNVSARFSTAAGTDTATLTKLVEAVTPGVTQRWHFIEGQASSADGLWTVAVQEYAADGTPAGSPTVLYGPAAPSTGTGYPPHSGQWVPTNPLVELSVLLDADGFSSPLTAYMGNVGLDRARGVDDLHLLADGTAPAEILDPMTEEAIARLYRGGSGGTDLVIHAVAYSGGDVGVDLRNSRGQGLIIPLDTDLGGVETLFSEGGIDVTAADTLNLNGSPVLVNGSPVGTSSVAAFTDLSDVPHSYSGQAGQPPVVNSAENGLVFGLRPSITHPLWKKDASTGDIREEEYYQGGNYIRIGVATGGVHVGQKLLNSRGDGLIIPWDTNTSGVFDIFSTRDINVAAGRDLFLNAGRDLFLSASAALALSSGTGAINVPILSSDPGSPVNGDLWILNSGGVRSLRARIGGVTYTLGSTALTTVAAFTDLSDVPASYSGAGLELVRVNSGATGLEFALYPRIGYVQSSDPGAVGAGIGWVDTTSGPPAQLKVRNSGNSAWLTVGGVGSVTSVGMAGDGTVFNSAVTGSPVVGAGAFAPSLKNQSAHAALIGPTSGSPAAPTFRALAAGDLPASVVINPMTTPGDLIVGGSSGTPTALPINPDGQFLQTFSGGVVWGGLPAAPTPTIEFVDFTINSADASQTMHRIDTSGNGADLQVTLPVASGVPNGWRVGVAVVDATYNVAINADSHDSIRAVGGDVGTLTLTAAGQTATVESDGTGLWYIVALYL